MLYYIYTSEHLLVYTNSATAHASLRSCHSPRQSHLLSTVVKHICLSRFIRRSSYVEICSSKFVEIRSSKFILSKFVGCSLAVQVPSSKFVRRSSFVSAFSLELVRRNLFVEVRPSKLVRRNSFVEVCSSELVRRSSFVGVRSSQFVRRSSFVEITNGCKTVVIIAVYL